jgi:hypothetical protein
MSDDDAAVGQLRASTHEVVPNIFETDSGPRRHFPLFPSLSHSRQPALRIMVRLLMAWVVRSVMTTLRAPSRWILQLYDCPGGKIPAAAATTTTIVRGRCYRRPIAGPSILSRDAERRGIQPPH